MRAVGYRQIWAWLDGGCSREEAIDRSVIATAQLAKRQLTWMRAEKGLERLSVPSETLVDEAIQNLRRQRVPAGQL